MKSKTKQVIRNRRHTQRGCINFKNNQRLRSRAYNNNGIVYKRCLGKNSNGERIVSTMFLVLPYTKQDKEWDCDANTGN